MKNRLIISITDVKGTRSYNVHKFVKRLIFILIVSALLLLLGSFSFITYLNNEIEIVKEEKETQLQILSEKEAKLLIKVKAKAEDIEELTTKLDDIHAMIGVSKDASVEEINKKTLETMNINNKKYSLNVIPNGKPIEKISVSSNFGYRINPITKKRQFHKGLDLPTPRRTPVYATANGVVEYVQSQDKGAYGRVIRLDHSYGFQTVFAHLRKTNVKVGDVIKKGQLIGLSGNSGRSSGPHLHYEVRYANKVLNPKNFIKWDLDNYDKIFKSERRVEWESLISQINEHHHQELQ